MFSRYSIQGLQEYEERLEAVRELKQKIENSSNLSGMLENTIDELHNQWYPKILSTIQIINSNFEMFMKSMECAGEVELIRGDAVWQTKSQFLEIVKLKVYVFFLFAA